MNTNVEKKINSTQNKTGKHTKSLTDLMTSMKTSASKKIQAKRNKFDKQNKTKTQQQHSE
jgi:hypothetical protein